MTEGFLDKRPFLRTDFLEPLLLHLPPRPNPDLEMGRLLGKGLVRLGVVEVAAMVEMAFWFLLDRSRILPKDNLLC